MSQTLRGCNIHNLKPDELLNIMSYLTIGELSRIFETLSHEFIIPNANKFYFLSGNIYWISGHAFLPTVTLPELTSLLKFVEIQQHPLQIPRIEIVTKTNFEMRDLMGSNAWNNIGRSSIVEFYLFAPSDSITYLALDSVSSYLLQGGLSNLRHFGVDIYGSFRSGIMPLLHKQCPQLESIRCFFSFSEEDMAYFLNLSTVWPSLTELCIGSLYERLGEIDLTHDPVISTGNLSHISKLEAIGLCLNTQKFPKMKNLQIFLTTYDELLALFEVIYNIYYRDSIDCANVNIVQIEKVDIEVDSIHVERHWQNLELWKSEVASYFEHRHFNGLFPSLQKLAVNTWLPSPDIIRLLVGVGCSHGLCPDGLCLSIAPGDEDPATCQLLRGSYLRGIVPSVTSLILGPKQLRPVSCVLQQFCRNMMHMSNAGDNGVACFEDDSLCICTDALRIGRVSDDLEKVFLEGRRDDTSGSSIAVPWHDVWDAVHAAITGQQLVALRHLTISSAYCDYIHHCREYSCDDIAEHLMLLPCLRQLTFQLIDASSHHVFSVFCMMAGALVADFPFIRIELHCSSSRHWVQFQGRLPVMIASWEQAEGKTVNWQEKMRHVSWRISVF